LRPRLQAILIADYVYEDRTTGKKVVAGIFDKLFFIDVAQMHQRLHEQLKEKGVEGAERHIPGGMVAGSPTAYMRLTDIRGTQDFTLRYVFLNEEQLLFSADFRLESSDPLESIDVVLPLPPLPAKQAGTFSLDLVWQDEIMGSHRIVVQEMPLPE
jgi:hypothetical protein